MSVEEAILEKVRSLAPEQQQRVLDFADSLGRVKLPVEPERSLADFYGICADDPIVIDGEDINAERGRAGQFSDADHSQHGGV